MYIYNWKKTEVCVADKNHLIIFKQLKASINIILLLVM